MKRLIILALLVFVVSACNGDDDGAANDGLTDDDPDGPAVELPDDFPLPVPDGADVRTAARQETDGGISYGALIRFGDGRYDELVAFYDDYFAGDDLERTETTAEREGVTWRNPETGLLVTVSQTVASVTLAVTVPPGSA